MILTRATLPVSLHISLLFALTYHVTPNIIQVCFVGWEVHVPCLLHADANLPRAAAEPIFHSIYAGWFSSLIRAHYLPRCWA
jgi:hypothetical protein